MLTDQSPGVSPRRRRNDTERRQSERNSATSKNIAGFRGRRQSDQLIAPTPVIKEGDGSVASRLDDLLRSELAANGASASSGSGTYHSQPDTTEIINVQSR